MKKIALFALLAVITNIASAFDYKFNLEGRADFINASIKTTTVAATPVVTTEKFNNFANSLIRLNMVATVNENLLFRFRYRFIKTPSNPQSSSGSAGTRENADTGTDYLFVEHRNSMFTTRFGKQNWVEAYGRESIVSGTDVFLLSEAGAQYKTLFGSDFRYGITAMFKHLENRLSLAVSNPNSTFTDSSGAAANPERKNTGLALGAYYTGSFLGKAFQPLFAYSVAQQNGDTDAAVKTKDGNNSMWNAGFRSEVSAFVMDLDYKMAKKANRNDVGTTNIVEEKTKSIYANLAYTIAEFTPMFIFINDKFDSETATANFKRNSFAVGTYWKPFADVNFRYHAMFTSAQKKADGTTSTVSKVDDKKMYFGFKADI
ncbi:MAG: hypothetical protein WC635_08020 [Bacteriovorax sp.]